MIRRVRFENFKALRDVEITFDERLTVLVGPNGSGKSSVLQGIQVLSQLAPEHSIWEEAFRGSLDFSHVFSGPKGANLLLQAEFASESGPNALRLSVSSEKPRRSDLEWMRVENGLMSKVDKGASNKVRSELRPTALVRFSAERLTTPSMVQSTSPTIEQDGGGLASTLKTILAGDPDRFRAIESAFKRVIPTVKGVRFGLVAQMKGVRLRKGSREAEPQESILDRILIDFQNAQGVPAESVSDGTMYVLGLLTVIFGPRTPKIVLCDDLDHGLHPKAQMELIRVLRELMAEVPDLQIIATSHSLYVLSELPESSIRVLTLGPDGGAVCGRLSDHPDYESWKEAMTPGEFWSHVGEEWLLKREPAVAQP